MEWGGSLLRPVTATPLMVYHSSLPFETTVKCSYRFHCYILFCFLCFTDRFICLADDWPSVFEWHYTNAIRPGNSHLCEPLTGPFYSLGFRRLLISSCIVLLLPYFISLKKNPYQSMLLERLNLLFMRKCINMFTGYRVVLPWLLPSKCMRVYSEPVWFNCSWFR